MPIRHPEQQSLRVMRGLSAMTIIQKWAELLHHIEEWLIKTGKKGYSPTELMFREKKHGIFDKTLSELKHNILDTEDLDTKLERAFSRIKEKAVERKKKEENK
jgi:SOS response regulatory protein OraA/RecX